jgi:hypothetical protein
MVVNAIDATGTYIFKDGNRPEAFASHCELEIATTTDAISFPSSKGVKDVRSRRNSIGLIGFCDLNSGPAQPAEH